MRVAFTADLYRPDRGQAALDQLLSAIQGESPDLFVIAGNIGEPLATFKNTLARFADLPCAKALVTGNLDVWNREGELGSQRLWEESLPIAIRQHNFTWLEQENVIMERIGLCGTMGWYDYSGRDTTLGYSLDQYEELKGLVNDDARYVDWPWSDREFAGYLQENFAARIEQLERDRRVDHILVVTHHPVFKETIVQIRDDIQWRFGTAYAFNLTLGRIITPKIKVRHVVSGHTRLRGQWESSFGNNTFKIHTIGRKNGEPRTVTIEIKR